MKIIHIITGLNDGGAEGVLYRLCSHDKANEHVVISLLGYGKYGPLLRAKGFKVYALGMGSGYLYFFVFLKLIQLLLKEKPDVIQTWMYHADLFGSIAARVIGIKAIVWGIRHSILESGKSKKLTILIAKLLAKLSSWLPTRIAVCAKSARDAHTALGYDHTKMRIIPNGYDLKYFKPMPNESKVFRAEWGIESNTVLIGTVGRYDPQKDFRNLLQAVRILYSKNISLHCVLVGTNLNSQNQKLVAQIRDLGIEKVVSLLDQRVDIPAIMSTIDIYVLSSSSEAFPNTVAEAMACETPCVVTDVGDAAYIVGNTGWIVPPLDSEALAEAILLAFYKKKQPQWQKLCSTARNRIEKQFNIVQMVDNYRKLWHETLTSSKKF